MKTYFTKKEQIVILIVIGLIVSILGFKFFSSKFIAKEKDLDDIIVNTDKANNEINIEKDKIEQEAGQTKEENFQEDIIVHISGQVKNPGIVELSLGKRLIDAVELLGGLTPEADGDRINLAKKLQDEEKIYIPKIGEEVDITLVETVMPTNETSANNTQNSTEKIDINICTKENLNALPGIGDVLATRIIEYREANIFKTIEDIMNVPGIGVKKFEGLKDLIIVKWGNIMGKRLTELTKTSGWAGKIGPDILSQVLRHLPKIQDENLIVGLDTADDAAVYKINEDLAIIQTLDFFTPVVDDPYTFGQIAAANSLSDIYAMGGEPKLCMNIVCFPDCLNPEILTEILKGGFDKVKESGALLVGGHSVSDDEPKYGLSITGFVNPKKVLTNSNAKVGDVLIITKPLGLGIINTAIKGEIADAETYKMAVEVMTTLNKFGKEAIEGIDGVNSVTDITGFGLLGHALEMAEGSDVTININYKSIPLIKNSLEYARMGLVPAGTYANKTHIGDKVLFEENVPEDIKDVLYDPQTSGGLMISVSKEDSKQVLERLKNSKLPYGVIGEVQKYEKNFINVK